MATKLSLYNGALVEIGERTLASLGEAREPRRVLDEVFDRVVSECLEEGQWNFAERTVQMDYDPSVALSFSYQYAFSLPTDFVSMTGISASEQIDSMPLMQYSSDGAYWFADITPIYVRYVSNDPLYGMNMGRWPGTFTRYVELMLASRIVDRIAQSETKRERIDRDVIRARRNAKNKDARQSPVRFPPAGTLVQSRTSRLNRRYDRA